jgi:hypothetical protein
MLWVKEKRMEKIPVFAFPIHPDVDLSRDQIWGGMTLRDYFAAHAMQAMLSNLEFLVRVSADQDVGDSPKERVSNVAYAYADEMMKARGD